MGKPLFPLVRELPDAPEAEAELALPENATPLEFLEAVYRHKDQPIGRRLTAAIAAAPFRHAKVNINADMDGESFAKMMDEIARKSGRSNVIDAKASHAIDAPSRPAPQLTEAGTMPPSSEARRRI